MTAQPTKEPPMSARETAIQMRASGLCCAGLSECRLVKCRCVDAITEAILSEREANAKVADDWAPIGYAGDIGERIAASIRARD